jgi:hypothetical protein
MKEEGGFCDRNSSNFLNAIKGIRAIALNLVLVFHRKRGFSTEKGQFSTIALIIIEQKTIGTSSEFFGFLRPFSVANSKVAEFRLLNLKLASTSGSIVDLFAMEGSGKLKKGETARVCGLPIGRAEVTNAVGGKFTHLILVSFIP